MNPRARQIQWLLIVGGYWVLQFFYLISPVDIVPDPLPGVGQLDDAAGMGSALLLTLFAMLTKRLSGKPKAALPNTNR